MKKISPYFIAFAFVALTAAGASRYINGTAIPQNATLVTTTGSQTVTLGAVTAAATGSSDGVTGTGGSTAGTSGVVGVAGSGGGYALEAQGDETSPVYGALRLLPQDTAPTTCALGDVYVNASSGTPFICTSTLPVWTSFSNQGTKATVAAAGTNQATGTALTAADNWVRVTGADGTKGVTLPSGSGQRCIRMRNVSNTSDLNVYGHNSDNDTIEGGAADAVFVLKAAAAAVFCSSNGTDWLTY